MLRAAGVGADTATPASQVLLLTTGYWLLLLTSFSSNAEGVGDAVDVVEPGGDERDLEASASVEAGGAQALVVCGRDARGVARELRDVVEHRALGVCDGRARVVLFERPHQAFV